MLWRPFLVSWGDGAEEGDKLRGEEGVEIIALIRNMLSLQIGGSAAGRDQEGGLKRGMEEEEGMGYCTYK